MRDKALFGASCFAVSLALFGAVWGLTAAHLYVPRFLGFLIPAIAVIVCALGVSWRRKAITLVILLAAFTAFDLASAASGLQALATHPVATTSWMSAVSLVMALLYALVPLVFPIAAVVLFVGRDPQVLWAGTGPPTRPARSGRTRRR
jgi:hypothetical protein